MSHKCMRILAAAILLGGAVVFAAPPVTHASPLDITSIVVNINGNLFNIWTPFLLNPGQTALLAQNSGYNFDTSDFCIPNSICTVPPTITVNLAGGGTLTYTDLTNLLGIPVPNDNNTDPPLETREYLDLSGTCVAAGGAICADLMLQVGYADDAHLQAPHTTCGPNPNDPNSNCRPDPFTADIVQAIAASGGCLGSVDPCFDTGVLYLTNIQNNQVPVPATLFLLGTALLGVAVWGRRSLRN